MQNSLRKAYKVGIYLFLAAFSFVLSFVVGNNRIGGIQKGNVGILSATPEAYADVVGSVGSGEGSGSAIGSSGSEGSSAGGGAGGGSEGGGSSSCSSAGE